MSWSGHEAMTAGIAEKAQWNPRCLHGLAAVGDGLDLVFRAEQEWRHWKGCSGFTPRLAKRHLGFEMVAGQTNAAFLAQFPEGGVQEVGVGRITASAREGPLPGPWIVRAFGATHKQDGVRRSTRVHDSHGRLEISHTFL